MIRIAKKTANKNKASYIKTTIPMPKDMVRFLHNMGLNAKTSNRRSHKIPKSTIVRAICQALEEVNKKVKIDLRGAVTQEEIKQRILKVIKRYKG